MATTRRGRPDEPAFGGRARRGHELPPKRRAARHDPGDWTEAAALPLETDPDTIDDAGVRAAFLDRLTDEAEAIDEQPARHPLTRQPPAPPSPVKLSRPSMGGDGGGLLFGMVLYALVSAYIGNTANPDATAAAGGWPAVKEWLANKLANGYWPKGWAGTSTPADVGGGNTAADNAAANAKLRGSAGAKGGTAPAGAK